MSGSEICCSEIFRDTSKRRCAALCIKQEYTPVGEDGIVDAEVVVDVEVDVDEGQSPEDKAELSRLRVEVARRCGAAGIKYEESLDADDEGMAYLHMPAGRATRRLPLYGVDRLRLLLQTPFEKFVLLADYSAVCSYAEGTIEADLVSLTTAFGGSRAVFDAIAGKRGAYRFGVAPPALVLQNPSGHERVILGARSNTLAVLGNTFSAQPRASIRIEGLTVSQHDDAVDALERVANSTLFQLDLTRGAALGLLRRRLPRPLSRRDRVPTPDMEFPRSEFDREPLSLYWYGRSATGIPLLQFLAYYQSIEFYFPTYAQAEARRKIRNILKNPAFRLDRDADLARVLLAARSSAQGFGDERSQLRATVNECVEPGALRAFLSDPEREKFFSTKAPGLTDRTLPIRKSDADLRSDVADRIYDIRCKIVHTKAGTREGEVELLLPYSREAELLYMDIELVQFVAREVLVSASTNLRL
jgi:hypothetical protein